jgi:IS30 family transposase
LRIRSGKLREEAATEIGLHSATGERWFSQAGGVIPAYVRAQSSGRYLSLGEREDIFAGVERGESIRFIAKGLGRAPSTVLRELRRNMRHRYRTQGPRSGRQRLLPWDYRPSLAQQRADAVATRPKQAKLATNLMLRELVEAKLKEQLSPEQISAQLRREFPSDTEMWVSHEAIYQSIYVQGRGALRRELAVCLRTGRALRRPHRKGNERRGRIPAMVNISERPAEVEDRAVPGHWEGDPRQERQIRHRHLGREVDSLPDAPALASRAERARGRGSNARRHPAATPSTLEVVDLGPGQRDDQTRSHQRCDWSRDLLLRPSQPLAAGLE